MTTTAVNTKAAAIADALRQLAADIESGALPTPYDVHTVAFWELTPEGQIDGRLTQDHARAAMTATPGNWAKDLTGNYVNYTKHYGGGLVEFQISMDRETVCRKVQVGTKEIPAVEAHSEPVYEWVCDQDPADPAES